MKFKELPNDASFRFMPSKDGLWNDTEVYIKIDKRDYIKKYAGRWADGYPPAQVYSVGTINVNVEIV